MTTYDAQLRKLAPGPTTQRASQRLISPWFTRLFILPILAYQYLMAPLIADCCRFHPRCSTYTQAAIIKYGVVKGIWLGMKRLVRCHPWGDRGYDPVP